MSRFVIRLFDVLFSFTGILLLLPIFILVSIIIVIDSAGSPFFRQVRVGRNDRDFILYKFRTMKTGAADKGLTVGEKDARITRAGLWLRKSKLDELPQLYNVLRNDMSLVGPRPEVRKFVEQYSAEQRRVLSVKPGITDFASIEYSDENAILGRASNPESTYVREIMPHKIKLNMKFIDEPTVKNYFRILVRTMGILR